MRAVGVVLAVIGTVAAMGTLFIRIREGRRRGASLSEAIWAPEPGLTTFVFYVALVLMVVGGVLAE